LLNHNSVCNYETSAEAFKDLYNTISTVGDDVVTRSFNRRELRNIMIVIDNPLRRSDFVNGRGWNLRCAFAEFLWYMSATPLIKELEKYIPRWVEFSDDGKTVNSNYGVYWLRQIPKLIRELKRDPASTRAVLTVYDGHLWLDIVTRDAPCTVSIQFFIRNKRLDMTVYMRSNDLWWGFCNDQFSFTLLQELIANELGIVVGTYTHFAGSLHIYERHFGKQLDEIHTSIVTPTKATFSNFWKDVVSADNNDLILKLASETSVDISGFIADYHNQGNAR
jgi:thymidylate synthase